MFYKILIFCIQMSIKRLKVNLLDFQKNPNIGSYIFANNKFALVPFNTPVNEKQKIKETLNVSVYETKIGDSDLLGVFILGNDDYLFIPEGFELLTNEKEDFLEKHNVKLIEIQTEYNSLANNVVILNDFVITHSKMEELGETIAKILNKELILLNEKNFDCIGSSIKANSYGLLINPLFSDENKKILKQKINKLKIIEGTVNDENPFVSSGLVINDKGILIGEKTIGEEILKIEEAFQPDY